MNVEPLTTIEREVKGWPGVTTGDTGRGGLQYSYGRVELGHLHGSSFADLPFPKKVRERNRGQRAVRSVGKIPDGSVSPVALVIADTHIPRRAKRLPKALLPHIERADLILHAGDFMDPALLGELAAYAPVRAVRGNVDGPDVNLPEMLEFEFGGVRIALIHDSGPKKDRRTRMRRRFPEARVVVFGHSHIPLLEDEDGLLLLNPGSPTDRRRQLEHTFALLRVEEREARAEIKFLP